MRPTRLLACLTVVGTLVAFAAVPASAATPTVTATPNTVLGDGQSVSVSASGFAANTEMAVVECPGTEVSPATCDLNTVVFATTDAAGGYSAVPFVVSRILSDGTDCALGVGCYIGTQDGEGVGPTAATLIKFDPNIPPIPKLAITVRFDKTPTVNSKGVVAVKGTVVCKNRSSFVEIDVDLSQIYNRAIFESSGFTLVPCAANAKTPFRITIRPQNGLFGAGPAVIRFVALAGDLFVGRRVAVDLKDHGGAAAAHSSARPHLTWR